MDNQPSKLKNKSTGEGSWLMILLPLYGLAGGIISLPLLVSYLYAACYVLWVSIASGHVMTGLSSAAMLVGLSAFYSGIRFFLWFPSLLLWLFAGDISFGQWLAPGFYMETVD